MAVFSFLQLYCILNLFLFFPPIFKQQFIFLLADSEAEWYLNYGVMVVFLAMRGSGCMGEHLTWV